MNCIFTINIKLNEKRGKIYDICEKSQRAYAEKIGADFISITEKQFNENQCPHVEKLQAFELLEKYEKILYVDADVLIKKDAPDIFTHEKGYFYALSEAECIPVDPTPQVNEILKHFKIPFFFPKVQKGEHKYKVIGGVEFKVPAPEWPQYFNTGVMLFDRSQINVWKKWDWKEYFETNGNPSIVPYEQNYINSLIIRFGFARALDMRFNMIMTYHENKKETAHFLHYTNPDKVYDTIEADYEKYCL